uniref:Mitochondrial import inner membrane translocase subunit TIM16 n=1 Tax=Chrysotila carterae TaxID=13221 RepID=A0A7S4C2I0_CHRCT
MVGAGLARLFANLLVMGSGVVGRAFMEAYKQALANGGAAAQAAGKSSAKSAAAQAEARQILNVTQKATKEEILEAHEKLTKMNDPEKGGSAYLNAKVRDVTLAVAFFCVVFLHCRRSTQRW